MHRRYLRRLTHHFPNDGFDCKALSHKYGLEEMPLYDVRNYNGAYSFVSFV